MKTIWFLAFLAIMSFSASGQNNPEKRSAPADREDTLRSVRGVFSTAIFQKETRLRPAAVMALYRDDAVARRRFRAGQMLTPVAPLVSLIGVGLGYVALKGKRGTYVGYYNGDPVEAPYVARSRPQLVAGLGLFVAGIVLVELSNELVASSAQGYNNRHEGQLISKARPKINFGITPGGNLGLFARF